MPTPRSRQAWRKSAKRLAGRMLFPALLVLSVRDAARGRITLYLTGTRRHDWDDLRRLAHTLSVDR